MTVSIIIAAAAVIVALALIEKAPAILQALADVRVAGRRDLDGLMPVEEALAAITLAVKTAIRRADPGVGDELVERITATVLEDVDAGLVDGLDDPRTGAE